MVGKARNITPAAMNAAVRMKEQTTVTMIGDLPLLLRVCGGITDNGDNRLDETNASQTAMVMRRLWYYVRTTVIGRGRRSWWWRVAGAGAAEMGFGAKGKSLSVTVAGQTQKLHHRRTGTRFHEALFSYTHQCSMLQIARHRPAPTFNSCLSSHAIRCCKCLIKSWPQQIKWWLYIIIFTF